MKKFWSKIKPLLSKKIWITWAIISILFAVLIHFLFVLVGPDWLQARWGAGDILTYVGTVSLGLLAVWQNERFKKENDIAQERLERLSQQSNELAIINKILEHEERRIEKITTSLMQFDNYTDLTKICACENKALKNGTFLTDMPQFEKDLQNAFTDVIEALVNEPFVDTNELRSNIGSCLAKASMIIDGMIHGEYILNGEYFQSQCDQLKELKLKFLELRNNYIKSVNENYEHLLYGNPSLQDIHNMRVKQIKTEKEG